MLVATLEAISMVLEGPQVGLAGSAVDFIHPHHLFVQLLLHCLAYKLVIWNYMFACGCRLHPCRSRFKFLASSCRVSIRPLGSLSSAKAP